MAATVLDQFRQAVRHLRPLLAVHLTLRLIGLALLAPVTVLAVAGALRLSGRSAITDKDIVWFFYLPPGTLILLAAVAVAVLAAALDVALMTVVLAAGERRAAGGAALALGTLRRWPGRIIGACGALALRLLWRALPFVAGLMLIQRIGLRRHELEFYLVTWPPGFLLSVLGSLALVAGLVRSVIRCLAEGGIALPLALSGQIAVRCCLADSARLLAGAQPDLRRQIALWAGIRVGLAGAVTGVMAGLTGTLPGLFGAELRLAAAVVAMLLLVWAVLAALVAALSNGALAALLLAAHKQAGGLALPDDRAGARASPILLCGAALVVGGSAVLAPRLIPTFTQSPEIRIIARPAALAPGQDEALAAIRRAIASGADATLIGVAPGGDGPVALADSPGSGAADLRDVLELAGVAEAKLLIDIGGPGDGAAQVAAVAGLVEETDMGGSVAVMSASIPILNRMRLERPDWRSGMRATWPMGDLSGLGVDFLALNAGQVTMKRVWRAKSAGKEVYAWPADRPLTITRVIEQGVTGIITADPVLARQVATAHGRLPLPDRLLLWIAGRLNPASLRLAEPPERH